MAIIGLDIGGTKLAVVVADDHGRIIHKTRQPTESARGPKHIIDSLALMAQEAAEAANVRIERATGVGVSYGGPFDSTRGLVGETPNLPGWKGVPLRRILSEAFPETPVAIDNDANAGALAEWKLGAGRGFRHVVYMTMGTGIGAGVVSDGRLMRGANDMAGEIGHICLVPDGPPCGCGRRGCLEAFCSGPSIARRAREKLSDGMDDDGLLNHAGVLWSELRTEHIVAAAKEGNAFAVAHLRDTARYLGWGVSVLVNILNPEIVTLGTMAVAAGELLLNPLREYVRAFAIEPSGSRIRIEAAGLGELVGDYAAVALILNGVHERDSSGRIIARDAGEAAP